MEATTNTLKTIEDLEDVPAKQLEWMISQSRINTYKKGDKAFKKGDPIDKMYIILKGAFVLKIDQKEQSRVVGTLVEKSISGYLPYSRATIATGTAEATEDSKVLELDKSYFEEMILNHHELTAALVHVMSSRIRHFTKLQQQNDKMMALGKLSAGLAHELNNPSAAVVRSASTLRKHLTLLPDSFKDVISIQMTKEEVDTVNNILFKKLDQGIQDYSLTKKTELEDETAELFEEMGFEDGYELAENFVDYGFSAEDLENISKQLQKKDMKPVIGWLNQMMTTERLVSEIEEASCRIHDLVSSVKSYTHMDQAAERQKVDLHKGINNTLTMLNHKLKRSGISVKKNYETDLVQPCIYISEMNQVWTNLIDNAIDALENINDPVIEIETLRSGDYINVLITDNGEGISEDNLNKIFDPFFTTKSVGKGTGLGLDVVQQIIGQHNGSIDVESQKGKTQFKICIPIE